MIRTSSVLATLLASTALSAPALGQSDQIVVTATRRDQSVIEVPYNISAYSSEDLRRNAVSDFNDFSRLAPGLVYSDQGPAARGNNNTFIMRGLNANSAVAGTGVANLTVATVSTYLGETPVFFPMTMTDIERVEVLRGPQGTLYGSGAAGGAIRVIPKDPDTQRFTAEINSDVSFMAHSDDMNWNVDGVVNFPIAANTLGLRVAGGYEDLGGFIDARNLIERNADGVPTPAVPADPASGFVLREPREDVNDSHSWYVRSTILFRPSDNIELRLSHHHQEDQQSDQQVHNPDFPGGARDISEPFVPGGIYPNGATEFRESGKYEQNNLFAEPYERNFDLYSLDATVDFGFASLTSATSYYENRSEQTRDVTGFFETPSIAYYYAFYPRLTVPDIDEFDDEGFVQEVRLVSDWDRRWNYVVGFFYQNLENKFHEEQFVPGINDFFSAVIGFPGANPALGDLTFTLDRTFDFEDIAVFGELQFSITDRWRITGGVRAFWQDAKIDFQQILPFCGALCSDDFVDPLGSASANVSEAFQDQVFKANISYALADDLNAYFTYSEGFRRGGANGVPIGGLFASLPRFLTFQPDKAKNYEIGLKGKLGEHVTFSTAAYYINWTDFQFDDFTPAGFSAVINGEEARSLGFEIEAAAQITDNINLSTGYTFTDAEVTESFAIEDLAPGGLFTDPPTTISQILVFDGDPLPGVPKHSFVISADYAQRISTSGAQILYHVNGSYRSGAASTFNPVTQGGRQFFEIEGFSIWDASVSLEKDQWSLGVFVDNIFNEEGLTAGLAPGLLGERGAYFYVTRPRTVGVRLRAALN